ncbi:MAG TPA: hypothetical protein VF831_08855 [Anaerolineales bacterium]
MRVDFTVVFFPPGLRGAGFFLLGTATVFRLFDARVAFDFALEGLLAVGRPVFPVVFVFFVLGDLVAGFALPVFPVDFFTFRVDGSVTTFNPPALVADFTALVANDFRFVFDLPPVAGDFFSLNLAGLVFGADLLVVAGSFLPKVVSPEGFVLPSFDTSFTSLDSSGLEIKEAFCTLSALALDAAEDGSRFVLGALFFALVS